MAVFLLPCACIRFRAVALFSLSAKKHDTTLPVRMLRVRSFTMACRYTDVEHNRPECMFQVRMDECCMYTDI